VFLHRRAECPLSETARRTAQPPDATPLSSTGNTTAFVVSRNCLKQKNGYKTAKKPALVRIPKLVRCHNMPMTYVDRLFLQQSRERKSFRASPDRKLQGGSNSMPLPNYRKVILNRTKACLPMRLDLFVELKHYSSTIILSGGIKYSVRDLLCDVINNA